MDCIDDWGGMKRAEPKTPSKGPSGATSRSPKDISKAMAGFEPPILSLHFYEDVGYPWVQVVFEEAAVIHPELALRVGEALTEAAGANCVYLNSLRPMAIYFLLQLEPAFATPQDLPISRYGAPLDEIKACWRKPFGS